MTSPFFSIAIATYNRADMLARCIDSCLRQSFSDFEVVIVDGASTDRSIDLVRSIDDQRIRLFVQPENAGISAGRHDAVVHARGAWVLQVDSDHTLEPDALDVLKQAIDCIQDNMIGAVCARYRWDDGQVTPGFVPFGAFGYEERMRWVEQEGGRDGLFCARRTALLETNWFRDRRASMDALFHLNFSKRWRHLYLDRVLARQSATMDNSSTRGHRGRARMLQKWAPAMAWQYEEIVRSHGAALSIHGPRTLRAAVRQASLQNFYAGNRGAGMQYGWHYLRQKPNDVGFWMLLAVGLTFPSLLPRMNELRQAARNVLKL